MINYNNSTNEQKQFIEKRINQEVYCLANEDIQFILSSELQHEQPFTWDDFSNLYDEEIDEPCDIMQFFYVSNYLAKQLDEQGECVIIREGSPSIWGRCTYGQSLDLDTVFWTIFQDAYCIKGE